MRSACALATLCYGAGSMSELLSLEQAPAGLGAALRKAGFENFTAIQQAILDPALTGRDLRISSQTGSGKTVALGLLLAPTVAIAAAMAQRGMFAAADAPPHRRPGAAIPR